MKKYFVTACFILLVLFGFAQVKDSAKSFSIKAFVPTWKGATANLIVDGEVISTTTIQNDIYSFNGIFKQAQIAVVELQKRGANLFVPLFIEPGLIRIRTQSQFNLVAYGTPLNDLYLETVKRFDSQMLAQAVPLPRARTFKQGLAGSFIRQHPSSLVSLKLLDELFYLDHTANDTQYYALFSSLDPELQTSALGRKIRAEAAARFETAIGKEAPQLLLPNLSGIAEPLYQKGRFTLVNFWASWCAPCRKEHPLLKRLASLYTEKGFSVVSVSLDMNPVLWRKGIRDEGLVWRQLSDGKGWEGTAVLKYGVKAIPANFLLDENGVIIGKELSLADLEKRLAEALK
ncbi:MAG: hypothetical protein JWP88_1236 [Flaviaesturariibacter sp.]|nr:hypothetical protein [Flaviaesturariibacter sp.]